MREIKGEFTSAFLLVGPGQGMQRDPKLLQFKF